MVPSILIIPRNRKFLPNFTAIKSTMDKAIFDKYEPIIGLEVHVQLLTKSKAYCSDSTEFGAMPNTQVSPISLGHPGPL